MVLSKRERYIVAATIIAVSILVLDRYIVTPFLDRRAQIEAEKVRTSSVDRVLSKPFQWFSVLEVLKELVANRSA